ncbi:MAG: hypothetical protein ACTHMY_11910 [Solirubrobacteraceae bacterium]
MPNADELYGLPLDRFVPERTALARELRSAGRREEAGEVAALRKPSVAAWAVNQLVRTQRKAVDELFEAGDALRAAHDQVLAGGGDAGSLRTAVALQRAAVDSLTKSARGLLTSEGHELSPSIIERVTDTLQAAALDDDARAQVRDGRLERELRHVGLGMTPGAVPARTPRPKTTPAKPKRDRAAEREARRRVERATRAASAARERRDKAAQALEEADEALTAAERELADAEETVRKLGS